MSVENKKKKSPPFKPVRLLSSAELDNAPGYAEAKEKERVNRLLALLDVTQTIHGGFKLMPLTLERYDLLRISDSSLVRMNIPTPNELELFLWAMSPWYRFRSLPFVRRIFHARCRRVFIPNTKPLFETRTWLKRESEKLDNSKRIIEAVFSTLAQVFQDAPKARSTEVGKSFYDLSVSFVGTLARNYSWTESEIRRLPIARLLQYRRECIEYDAYTAYLNGKGSAKFVSPLDNPSDGIRMQHSIDFANGKFK